MKDVKTQEISFPGYGECKQMLHNGRYFVYSPKTKGLFNYNPYSKILNLRQSGVESLHDAGKIVQALGKA